MSTKVKITDVEASSLLEILPKFLKSNKYFKFNDEYRSITIKGFKNLDIIWHYNKRDYFLLKGLLEHVQTKRHKN